MTSVVIIEKSGICKIIKINNFDIKKLYKCCKMRKDNIIFCKRHTWKIDDTTYISAYCKNDGKAGTENKYELPQPLDKELYFNNIVLVKHTDSEIKNENCDDLSIEEWLKIYEKLMGGFEDLNDEDSYSEEDEIPDELKTQNGYMKDGFVVDDDEDIEYADSSNDAMEKESDEETDYETEEEYSSAGSELEEEEDTEDEEDEEDKEDDEEDDEEDKEDDEEEDEEDDDDEDEEDDDEDEEDDDEPHKK